MYARISLVIFVVISAATLMLTGCSKTSPPAASEETKSNSVDVATLNKVCPVMGGKVDPGVTVEWDGQTVGFCCAGCIPEFEKLGDEEKAAKLADAAAGKIENQMKEKASGSSPAT